MQKSGLGQCSPKAPKKRGNLKRALQPRSHLTGEPSTAVDSMICSIRGAIAGWGSGRVGHVQAFCAFRGLSASIVRVPIFRIAKNGRVAQQPEMHKMPMAVAQTPTQLSLRLSRVKRERNQSSRSKATGGLETTLRQLNTPRLPMRTMPEPIPTGHTQGEGE
jgi:hypothetical protein